MDYPKDFPEHLKIPVESAIAGADIQFRKIVSDFNAAAKVGFEDLLFRFVKKVFFAFAEQARKAIEEKAWTLERCREVLGIYLHNLIADAYCERNPSCNDCFEDFEDWATPRIYASNEWAKHQREIVALAAAPVSDKGSLRGHRLPHSHTKEDKLDPVAEDRQSLLLAYKSNGREKGIRITDAMIAKASNPGRWNDRTMVTWWKRNDPRCKQPHDKKIRAVLGRDPASIWHKE